MKLKLFAIIFFLFYWFSGCTDCPTEPQLDRTLIEHYTMIDKNDSHLSPKLDDGRIYQVLILNNNKYYSWFVVGEDTPVRYKNFIFADGLQLHGSIEVWLYRID